MEGQIISINSESYFQKGFDKLKEFKENRELLYHVALDYRFTIERLLFEYLVLVKNTDISNNIKKLYRAYDLSKKLLNIEPKFFKKLEFLNIYLECLGAKERIVYPDLDKLTKIYSSLNKYLHAPKTVEDSLDYSKTFYKLAEIIDDATYTLAELLSHPRGSIELNKKGMALFEQFSNEEISEEDVKGIIIEELNQFKKSP